MPGVVKISLFMMSVFVATAALAVNEHAVAQSKANSRHLMHMMDKDRNGQVSKAEYMRFMEERFNRLDADRNGSLSAKEMSKFCSSFGDINDQVRVCR